MKKPDRELEGACDPTSIGNVALMHGFVDDTQLRQAIAWQNTHGDKLGESMVEVGAMGRRTLQMLVQKQTQVRTKPSAKDVGRIVDFASSRLTSSATRIESTMRGLHGAVSRLLKR